ncbi:MAG: hypothetical protein ABIR94_01715, partial [Rubrivivax sp.]
ATPTTPTTASTAATVSPEAAPTTSPTSSSNPLQALLSWLQQALGDYGPRTTHPRAAIGNTVDLTA